MKRVLAFGVVITALTIAADSSAQTYRLDWLCINSGGSSELTSANYGAMLTVAQAVAGECESLSYKAYFGFWHPLLGIPVSVEEIETAALPRTFSLEQNYPNPFNPTTTIEFSVPHAGMVRIEIFNILGQLVNVLVSEHLQAGVYRVTWNGHDLQGSEVASGIYVYRLQVNGSMATRKMLLLK